MREVSLIDCGIDIRKLRKAAQSNSRFLRRVHWHDGLLFGNEVVYPASGDAQRSLFYRYRSNRMRCLFYIPVEQEAEVTDRLALSPFADTQDLACERFRLAAGAWFQFYCTYRPIIVRPQFGANSTKLRGGVDAHHARLVRDELARPHESYRKWFDDAIGTAAVVPSMSILDIAETRLWIERSAGIWELEKGNDVRVKGLINVLDEAAFARKLLEGVGQHAKYGYGFLLLKAIPPHNVKGSVAASDNDLGIGTSF